MKKLCFNFLVRHLSSSSCFLNHRYYSFLTATTIPTLHSHLLNLPNPTNPYFFIPTLPFSTTTTTTTRKPLSVYLIERLGFSEHLSLATFKKFSRGRDRPYVKQVTDLISFENADNVIAFLQDKNQCGLDLSQVNKVISKHPNILNADVDKTLKPKLTLLKNIGFSPSDLAHVLSRNPALYLKTDLTLIIQALRGVLGSDKDVVKVFKRLNYGTSNSIINNLIPNVTMLVNEYGISQMRVRKFLSTQPTVLMLKTETVRDGIVKMEDKWGISRDSTQYLRALYVFCGFSDENIDSKWQVFRNFGWSDSDILILIKKHPNCIASSEARIGKALKFYMNELGYDPAYLVSRSAVLNYSLENRVLPRHRVLSVLKEKGLIKDDYQLFSALILNDDKFFKKFILPYEKTVPELCQVYIDGRKTPSASEDEVNVG